MASVADQEGVSVEHVIQDGGSDGIHNAFATTVETLGRKEYQPRLVVEKDNGMYDAINRGLKSAHGEICAYLNCDEQYLPGTLSQVVRFFASHPEIDVLFGDAVLVDAEGIPLSYRRTI